ncbi:MAG: hypothetical protein HRU75_01160 [Planctomycetia bacterium]|nr:MAG: hypothetical protein HRU75_01160 [Planctomycetia bacterium]
MEIDVNTTFAMLLATAAGFAVLHTAAGPDHYLPFVAMGRAGRWSLGRTLRVAALCGAGHLLAAVGLGLVVLFAGRAALDAVGWVDHERGHLAAWLLIAFGAAYGLWGLRRALRNRAEIAPDVVEKRGLAAWILFLVFVLGPCEPMIPLLVAGAAKLSVLGAMIVCAVYSLLTLLTMLALVAVGHVGLARIRAATIERFTPALAGAAVAGCGVAMMFHHH